jgi:hypothetical protein
MNIRIALLAMVSALGAASAGCTHATMEVSHVPNPVLLGPIDRVGGHRGTTAKMVNMVNEEVSDFVAASSSQKQTGNVVVTTTTTTALSFDASIVAHHLLDRTEGRADRDVRVDRLGVGAWSLVTFWSVMMNRWVSINGPVVEVRR